MKSFSKKSDKPKKKGGELKCNFGKELRPPFDVNIHNLNGFKSSFTFDTYVCMHIEKLLQIFFIFI